MSNNKPKSAVTSMNQHLQNKGNGSSPKDVIAAANAQQAAKQAEEVKAPIDAVVEPEPAKTETEEPKKVKKRLSRKEWVAILEKKEKLNLTAAQIAEEHNVTEGNVYQWASKLKAEADKEESKEEAKNDPSILAAESLRFLVGVDSELNEFDAEVEKAKAFVANAVAQRKEIEASRNKYKTAIELFGTEEQKEELKQLEAKDK